MVSHIFLANPLPAPRQLQLPLRPRTKIVLDSNEIAARQADQRDKSARFKNDLSEAWQQLDSMTKTIAAKHSKSVRRVESDLHLGASRFRHKHNKISAWNAFCWKKHSEKRTGDGNAPATSRETLPDLARSLQQEYRTLSDADKHELIKDLEAFKENKSVGLCVSMRSRVNDVTHTIQAVENELYKLRNCTGVETILYTTCGTTDLPLRSISFVTQGVENFMGMVMNLDGQDLVSKMEGYTVQGVRGAASNYRQRIHCIRAEIRSIIMKGLCEITQDPNAKMQWSLYFQNVVQCYKVIIVGWPEEWVPFANLSSASSALSDLEMLLHKWDMGTVHWKKISEEEFQRLHQERNQRIENGEISKPTRRTRADKGTKRTYNSKDHGEDHSQSKRFRSTAVIVNSSSEEEGNFNSPTNDLGPANRASNNTSNGANDSSGTTSDPSDATPNGTTSDPSDAIPSGTTSDPSDAAPNGTTSDPSDATPSGTTSNPGGTISGSITSDPNSANNLPNLSSEQMEELWESINQFDPAAMEGFFFNELA